MSLVSPTEIITISISVTDRHASADWFDKVLGFKTIYHADEVGWSELHTNTKGVILGLGESTEPKPGNCVPVFGVTDLDQARQAMEAADIPFDGDTIVVDGMVKLATFFDPDNNALMLAQDLSGNS